MTSIAKERKIKLLKEDISIYQNIINDNPNDELSLDVLNFKKRQLEDIEKTPTEEELKKEQLFEAVLIRQKEVVNSVETKENKKVSNIIIYFNGKLSRWEVKYTIDEKEKNRYYSYNELFLKNSNEAYEKLIKRYGKSISLEYDKIVYGILNEIDVDLGTDLLKEFLNNNKTFNIIYDLRKFSKSINWKLKKEINKSAKRNNKNDNFHTVLNNSKANLELLKTFTEKKEEKENVVKLNLNELQSITNVKEEPKKEDSKEVVSLTIDSKNPVEKDEKEEKNENILLKDKLEQLKNIDFSSFTSNDEEIEVLENSNSNNMSLGEILKEEEIEVLDENPKKIA